MNEKSKNIVFYTSIFLIVILGLLLRVLFFSYARPFWNDESAMALNLINRNFVSLFASLDYNQAVPPLYAVICKLFTFGNIKAEYALRFTSLFFSVLSLPVFLFLSLKMLRSRLAVVFANILFALNYQLIYFSQELKHYSADVFFYCLVLFLYFYSDFKKSHPVKIVLIGMLLAVMPWISYTSAIAIFILFFVLLFCKRYFSLYLWGFPFLSAFIIVPFLIRLSRNNFLYSFWNDGFIAKDFSNINVFLDNNFIFYFLDYPHKIVVALMFIAGLWAYASSYKKIESVIVFSSLILAFILSYFSLYPIYLRTSLFIFPIMIFVLSKPFDLFKFRSEILCYMLAAFLFAHFSVCTLKTDIKQIINKQYYRETTPDLIGLYLQKSQPDKDHSFLVVTNLSRINFEFYKRYFNLDNSRVILMNYPLYELEEIKNAYALLPLGNTYYVLLTHSGDKKYEYKNLCAFLKTVKNAELISDKDYNILAKFSK